jgi:hypothetical protein
MSKKEVPRRAYDNGKNAKSRDNYKKPYIK